MTSTRKALIAAAVAVIFAVGLIFWQVKARKSGPVEFTAEDMAMIAEDQPPQIRARLATDEQARKDFALELRRLLAVAEEAEANGVGNSPDMKRQLEFQKASIIAQYYFEKQGEGGTGDITDDEVDEFFKHPVNQQKFDQIIADAKAKDPSARCTGDSSRADRKCSNSDLAGSTSPRRKAIGSGARQKTRSSFADDVAARACAGAEIRCRQVGRQDESD